MKILVLSCAAFADKAIIEHFVFYSKVRKMTRIVLNDDLSYPGIPNYLRMPEPGIKDQYLKNAEKL